jgi:hypothetical protein
MMTCCIIPVTGIIFLMMTIIVPMMGSRVLRTGGRLSMMGERVVKGNLAGGTVNTFMWDWMDGAPRCGYIT